MTAAKTATGVDNSANSASTLTSSSANGTTLQAITLAVNTDSYSVYLKRITGTGEVDITINGGTTWTPVTSSICKTGAGVVSGLLTTSYVRCQTSLSVTNPSVGIRLVANGDSVAADFSQLEIQSVATSPILTTTGAVARSADSSTLPSTFAASTGTIIILGGVPGPAPATWFSRNLDTGADQVRTNSSSAAVVYTQGSLNMSITGLSFASKAHAAFSWNSSGVSASVNGSAVSTEGTAFGSAAAYLGSANGSQAFNGYIQRVALFPTTTPASQLSSMSQ